MSTLPRRALILDTETSGTDPNKDRIIEVAVILYDLQAGSQIACFSALARGEDNAAEPHNKIPIMLLREALLQERVWFGVCELMAYADVILAHNAKFDQSFVEADEGFKSAWLEVDDPIPPWVCTFTHINWPNLESRPSATLASMALAYGVPVIGAHRAMTDVDILARMLTRVKELGTDLQVLIGDAMRPKVKVVARVSFEQKDLAKSAGFQWQPERKRWIREMVAEDVSKLKFPTMVVKD